MYAQLGNIIFTPVKGFTEVSFTSETNLVEHALIDGKPKLQRVGENLENLDVSILFDIAFCNPQAEIDALKSSRQAGEVMPLIMGNGRFVGNYVIRTVDQTNANEAPDGTLLQAEVSLTLIEYANEALPQASTSSALSQAFATAVNTPQSFSTMTEYKSVDQQASADVIASSASMNTVSTTLATMDASEELFRPKAKAIIRDMQTAGDTLDNLLSTINSDSASELYALTRNLATSIAVSSSIVSDVLVEAQALIDDIDANNTGAIPGRITSLVQRSVEIRSRSKQLTQSAADLVTYIVTH